MRILQVNCFFDRGSTGKIMADIHRTAAVQGHDMIACYGRYHAPDEKNVLRVSSDWEAKVHALLSRLWGVEFGFSPIATARLIRLIRRKRPDVVHLHCLNGHFVNVYRLVTFLKKQHIPTILTLHAEIMHTAGCEHAVTCEKWRTECHDCRKIHGLLTRWWRDDARHCYRKMKAAFADFPELTVVGVSPWLTDRAAASPIFAGAHFATVENGLDTATFAPNRTIDLRKQHNIAPDERVILHVTPHFFHPLKGGKTVLELAQRMPQHRFVVVGFDADPAVLPQNVIPVARTADRTEMAAYYTMADVTLLTSVRETFSMVTAESLCCGTPVVGFEAGAPETIALPAFSTFVPQGNVDALQTALDAALHTTYDSDRMVAEAHARYAIDEMTDRYLALYHQ